jgi:hypothetical protein
LTLSETEVTVSEQMYDGQSDFGSTKFNSLGDDIPDAAQGSLAPAMIDTDALIRQVRGPWVRAAQLPELFCSWDLAYRCTRGGWLRPIVQGKRRTIYRLADVLVCMQRIEAGELPLPRRNKAVQ